MMNKRRLPHLFPIAAVMAAGILFSSCSSVTNPASLIGSGNYIVTMDSMGRNPEAGKMYVMQQDDSLIFVQRERNGQVDRRTVPVRIHTGELYGKQIRLVQRTYDIDVFTTPFKYRRGSHGIPPQLSTSFNASVYFGYRQDFIRIRDAGIHPKLHTAKVRKLGYGFGVFTGLGSTNIKPFYLNNYATHPILYEYDAAVCNYGIALLMGYKNLSTGLALGNDYLLDRNRKHWIYQNKPWLGIFVGLNIN